jgi:hypothetical protein
LPNFFYFNNIKPLYIVHIIYIDTIYGQQIKRKMIFDYFLIDKNKKLIDTVRKLVISFQEETE